jgi:hypothetical protein
MNGSPSKDDQRKVNTSTRSEEGSYSKDDQRKVSTCTEVSTELDDHRKVSTCTEMSTELDDHRKVSTCSEVSTQLTTGTGTASMGPENTQGSDGNPSGLDPRVLEFGSTSIQGTQHSGVIAASTCPTQFSQLVDLQPGQYFSPAGTSSLSGGIDPEEAERKYKDVERRLEEDKIEKLKYCYLKEDDGDIIDLELFNQIRGIPATVTGPIADRSSIMAMKTTALKKVLGTYKYIYLNPQGKETSKPVSRNTNRNSKGEFGVPLLRKRATAFNFWRYLKPKGILPARYTRPHGNTSEYTSNESTPVS